MTSYQALYEDPGNDPAGTGNTILHQVGLTMGSWDASTSQSSDEITLLQDVLLVFGDMSGGIDLFV